MSDAPRPDPDELLARVEAEEARARRGRLRIFFGASAGVGKTYAMLEAAQAARANRVDVVVGYVEPHGRADTEGLLAGLESLPTRAVTYRGLTRQELDLDAALARRPSILLVDELAHSLPVGGEPPPRHAKRWQDVEELLNAGINVWTTLNVQHLESLNDVVARASGVVQQETLPDRVFDEAEEVELIDVPPEDLLARLAAGKVYVGEQAATAAERFFRKPNLLALRELALRRVADRVEAAARAAAPGPSDRRRTLVGDRLLVAIRPDDRAEQLIRAGRRMADALDADWTVVCVETPAMLRMTEAARDRRVDLLRLAESLGAETVTLDGPSAAAALREYALTRHATRLLVGAPRRAGPSAWLRPPTAARLIGTVPGTDVIVLARSETRPPREAPAAAALAANPPRVRWQRYVAALLVTAACTGIAAAMHGRFEAVNLAMIYLLGVVVVGLRFGRGPSVLAAVANVLAFDFCFVPPSYSLAVSDVQYLFTLVVMLTVAIVIATLMAQVRRQTRVAGARERRTALLYAMSRELSVTRGSTNVALVAVRHVSEVFDCRTTVLLPDAAGKLRVPRGAPMPQSFVKPDLAVAQWVLDHGQRAGLGTDTLAAAPGLYLPLGDARRPLGVLAVLAGNPRRVLLPEQRHLLETFAGQVGLALERAQLAESAEAARVASEAEGVRNTLLASISHDLRTPLAVIAGAASTLAEQGARLAPALRDELARSIEGKAHAMSALVSNVLDLTRYESGRVRLRRDWQTIDDLVGGALHSVGPAVARHVVDVQLPPDLRPVHVDAALVVQALANLLDNAAKYTPPGTTVRITATVDGAAVRVTVEDDGPGLPGGDPMRLFEKFQRGSEEGSVTGVGLGLAIVRAIVVAHGGAIEAGGGARGGARFELTLPTEAPPA